MRKFIHHILLAGMVATVLTMVVACGGDDDGPNLLSPGQENEQKTTPTLEPDEKAIAARLEVPALKTGNKFIFHSTRVGNRDVMTYCLEFDASKMHSRWVAFRFDGDTRGRSTSRADEPFTDDPELPASMWIGSNTFQGRYDRGHLVASADRLYSREANEQTFYMSNMSPQASAFNQGYWITLENMVQSCGRNASFADTLYVVKGGFIDNTNDLIGWSQRNNGTRVAIPRHYFMALLRVKSGAYTSIAFWMENNATRDGITYSNQEQAPRSVIAKETISVDSLEELTGIDFFHNLPDNIENQVEATFNFNDWNK